MLEKAKQFGRPVGHTNGMRFSFSKRYKELKPQDVKEAREYIATYWKKLERRHTKDDGSVLGMPKPYLVSSYEEGHDFDFNELYYWDSYFMVQGLLDEEHKELVMGILEDLISLFKRFHTIPNASRTYLTGRSQPPLLTSFIFDLYDTYKLSNSWLKDNLKVAEAEYETVWMGTAKPNARQVYMGLSRYYDINMTHDLAEAESGWDYTPRFNRRCLDYLAVDLNALLYKYEADFARAARIFDNSKALTKWEKAMAKRKKTMNELMWDQSRGLYYDYNYTKEKRGTISSLAGYYPMWAGMADGRQAAAMVKALKRFEQKGGLSTTDNVPLGQVMFGGMPVQWAYPNGWAPLQLIIVKALQNYGYHEDAKRIAHKWLKCNLDWFNEHGVFLEKYNVAAPEKPPARGVYPSQTGFGWTNSVFERFCQEYIDNNHIEAV